MTLLAFPAAVVLALNGCQPTSSPSPVKKSDSRAAATGFRPDETGTIRGRVVWTGELPVIESIKLLIARDGEPREHPNPNTPRIDPKTNGVADVLVSLNDVDPARSRPWPYAAVEVVFDAGKLEVRQGEQPTRIGLVLAGDEISCRSKESRNHILVGRGSQDFSLPLFDNAAVTRRTLSQPGAIELSSGAALYWLRGQLFVSNNAYAATTAADGSFELPQVPAGTYELTLWSPNWTIVRRERNPELTEIERLVFAPPAQKSQRVTVTAGKTADATIPLGRADFPTK